MKDLTIELLLIKSKNKTINLPVRKSPQNKKNKKGYETTIWKSQ